MRYITEFLHHQQHPLNPGCLPMYLHNLSPAEDVSRLRAGSGHAICLDSTCDSATPLPSLDLIDSAKRHRYHGRP